MVQGDVFNLNDLEKAMNGCDAVHISLSTVNEGLATKIIVDIVKQKEIKLISSVSGCTVTEENRWFPMTEKAQKIIDNVIDKQSRKFYSTLIKKEYLIPTFFDLMIFRMSRTSINLLLDQSKRDYTYYKKNGWFESDYYYSTQLDPFKKMAGKFFDFWFNRI